MHVCTCAFSTFASSWLMTSIWSCCCSSMYLRAWLNPAWQNGLSTSCFRQVL
jgi:hypothetical protein